MADAKGGLLRQIGDFGILLVKDFGSILNLTRETRGPILMALREIYDGNWTRHVGTDGGRTLSWQGKVGLVGGATPSIDQHHAVMSALGERFVFYRFPVEGITQQQEYAAGALKQWGQQTEMRAELSASVRAFFENLTAPAQPPPLTDRQQRWLVQIATLVARCRSAVERDPYTREVVLVPGSEIPTRLTLVLVRLWWGLRIIGVPYPIDCEIVRKVAFDSMPKLRQDAVRLLAGKEQALNTTEVAETLRHPTNTIRRALEDLTAYTIVDRLVQGEGRADLWRLNDEARELYQAIATLPDILPVEYHHEKTVNIVSSISGKVA